jgi:hypothetical protein
MNAPKLTLQELKNIHPVESIAPYGIVLIIPSQEFNRNEIADLTEENKIIYSNYQGKSSVFIKLPPKQPIPEPATAPNSEVQHDTAQHSEVQQPTATSKEWQQPEIDLLIDLYEKETNIHTIVTEFQKTYPDRTENAIRIKGSKLFLKLNQPKTPTQRAVTINAWQSEETNLLIALWTQEPHLTVKEITQEVTKKYPKRTDKAIENRLTVLQKNGTIKSRWHLTRKTKPLSPSMKKLKKEAKHWNEVTEPKQPTLPITTIAEAEKQAEEEHQGFKTLIEAYEEIKKLYTEMKTENYNLIKSILEKFATTEDLQKLSKTIESISAIEDIEGIKMDITHLIQNDIEIKEAIQDHKHAEKSGEAMFPNYRWKKEQK